MGVTQQPTLRTTDGRATPDLNVSWFPLSASGIFSRHAKAAGTPGARTGASARACLAVGRGDHTSQVEKSAGGSAQFWLSSCPLYFPFSDTEKDKNLPFSGAKTRPRNKQQLSEQKEHRARLQCPRQLDHVQEAHPMAAPRGKPRHPRQPRAGGEGDEPWEQGQGAPAHGTARGQQALASRADTPLMGQLGAQPFAKGRETLLCLSTASTQIFGPIN